VKPSRSVSIAGLVLALLVGVLLRLWPSTHPPGTRFIADSAAIARLALASAPTGRLPSVDSLAEAPGGRSLGPVLAPGLIVSAGVFARAVAALGGHDRALSLVWFGALCGGLIAVPVFLWARLAWGPGWAAPFSALAIACLPAHLHRTFGYFLRYDAAGSLLVTAQLAALAAALAATRASVRRGWAAAAALLLLAALWQWRVPLVVPLLEAGFVVLVLLIRGAGPELRDTFPPMVLIVTPGLFGLEYLRAQGFPLSFTWLAVAAIAGVLFVPRLAPGRARAGERAVWVAAGLALAFVISRLTASPSPYSAAAGLLPLKVKMLLHLPVSPTPIETLLLSIEELSVLPPLPLTIGAMNLAFLGPWLVLAPLGFWLLAGRPGWRRIAAMRADHLLLITIGAAFLVLTVLLARTKVLLAPLAAVVAAGLLNRLLQPVPPGRPARPPSRGTRRAAVPAPAHGTSVRRMMAALLVLCVAGNAAVSVGIAGSRDSRPEPEFLEALRWLREHTAPGAVVATVWEKGYEVQSYAERPTLTDGFLESDVVLRRVNEVAHAFLQPSAEPLAAWCRAHGARDLLVPPSTQLLPVALLTGDPIVPKLRASRALTPAEADRVLIRMMVFGQDEPPFTKVFESGFWRVYRLDAEPAATAGSSR
jgi:asparagine N-glycosylation enzyme membrane subunit Stt3